MSTKTKSSFHLSKCIKGPLVGSGAYGEVYRIEGKETQRIYAAKILLRSLKTGPNSEMEKFLQQVDMISKVVHPTIVRFIGYSKYNFNNEPKPVLITEYISNGTLLDIIDLERRCIANKKWTDTGKLISIYGIAAGMSFLHAHNIIHRDLKPGNILMDDYLIPRICDFGFAKIVDKNGQKSTKCIMGTRNYIAPEIWSDQKYTFACDVYSFGVIVYEIFTIKEPWENLNEEEISKKVRRGSRPHIPSRLDDSYRKLIKSCWSQNPEDRPTFDDIINLLETDKGFLTPGVDKDEFLDFIDFIKESPASYDGKSYKMKKYFDRNKQKLENISLVMKPKAATLEIHHEKLVKEKKTDLQKNKKKSLKNRNLNKKRITEPCKKKLIYPLHEFNKLNERCKSLVLSAEDNPEKQFTLGQYLIEARQDFKMNTEIGLNYLINSINGGCSDAAVYYARILIEGDRIEIDLDKASSLLNKYGNDNSGNVLFLKGLLKKKKGQLNEAFELFEEASRLGNAESMYQFGKMLYKGIVCTKNLKKAKIYLERSKKNGFEKSAQFIDEHPDLARYKNDNKKSPKKSEEVKNKSVDENKTKITCKKVSMKSKCYQTSLKNSIKASSKRKVVDDSNSSISVIIELSEESRDTKKDIKSNKIKQRKEKNVKKKQSKEISSDSISLIIDDDDYSSNEKLYSEKNKNNKSSNFITNDDSITTDYEIYSKNTYTNSSNKTITTSIKNSETSYSNSESNNLYQKSSSNETIYSTKYSIKQEKEEENDDEIDPNFSNLASYYRKNANKGDIKAMIDYADMLYKGYGIIANKKKAAIYYKKAADNGMIDSMIKYAKMKYDGDGIPINKKEAADYFKMASDKENVDAMSRYADMLYNGEGTHMSKSIAASLYKKLADNWSVTSSMVKYAHMLYKGDGIRCNKRKAAHYYEKASYDYDMNAANCYADMLYNGDGIKKNLIRASIFYKKAAKLGHVGAMNSYANMLYNGDGIVVNKIKAYHYYALASEKGNYDAKFSLREYFNESDSY